MFGLYLKLEIVKIAYFLFHLNHFFLLKEKYNRQLKKRKSKNKMNNTQYEVIAQQVLQNNTGRHSYLGAYCTVASPHTTIGVFCSIADNVSIGTTHHPIHFLSTHPFCYYEPGKLLPHAKQVPFEYNTPCVIGNDVWIGKAVIIMDGVTVGDGAIIGSNAVVTKDVPPYAVVAGVPAKVLKYRFDEATIRELLALKWWELPDEKLIDLPYNDVQKCIEYLKAERATV